MCYRALLALLVGLAAHHAASACAQLESARQHFLEGERLEGLGEREDAIAAWERSYRAHPNWRALRRIATALEALGRDAEAAETLGTLLERHRADLHARDRRVAANDLARLSRRLATLTVIVTPEDARVVVGSRVVAPNQPLRLAAGEHVVQVARDGYQGHRATVRIRPGAEEIVRVALSAQVEVASLDVRTRPPAAEVYVDGERRGITPLGLQLPVGGHRLRIELTGFAPHEREIVLTSGAWERLDIPLSQQRELYEEAWPWVLLGLAAAGVAAVFVTLWATRTLAPEGTIASQRLPTP